MQELDDIELLRRYAKEGSEEAFARLATRYVNLVYSAALRKIANPHAAEEITQAVFIILARKADRLSKGTILSAWLYQATRLTAASFLRTEIRRAHREQEAYMQSSSDETESNEWSQIGPLLEDAMGQLGDSDRAAVVLRFFEKKSFQEVGAAFGSSENAAKKRVARALDKLRKFLARRGIVSTSEMIARGISAHSIHSAPVALAKSVAAAAITKGAATGGSTITLIKGALRLMSWTKAKTAIVAGLGLLLTAGTATIAVKEIEKRTAFQWQVEDPNLMYAVLQKAPPIVKIVPTRFPNEEMGHMYTRPLNDDTKVMGLCESLTELLGLAYGTRSPYRIFFKTPVAPAQYDYIASLPSGSRIALRQTIQKQLRLECKKEIRETSVLALRVKRGNAPGLRPTQETTDVSIPDQPDHRSWRHAEISKLSDYLEDNLSIPVLDQSGLAGLFDIDLQWKKRVDGPWYPEPKELKRIVLDQLGLELVPTVEPIEMLVVEKAK